MKLICFLNGDWSGRYTSPEGKTTEFSGVVPGCAHTDLLRAGIIKDPYFEYQAAECQFIENQTFEYEKIFDFSGSTEGVKLGFERLDTFCDIWLNGIHLGFCNNMFLRWDFDVENALVEGENKLLIRFYPPAEQVEGKPKRNAAFTAERIWIRRMQCTFGWDWVERFVTMGVEGDVMLYRLDETEIDSVYIATTMLDSYGAEIKLDLQFAAIGQDTMLEWEVVSPTGELVWAQRRAIVEPEAIEFISIKSPMLWWPNGYGAQPLYCLKMRVFSSDGTLLDERENTFGIRTIRILEQKDEKDSENWKISEALKEVPHVGASDENEEYSGYQILVNGQPIFCMGGNWVPSEPFLTDVRKEKVEELLRLTAKANMNMVRVWGGGVIESDDFYDICDRLGILVCQDFLMACGEYPEEYEEFLAELEKEANQEVKRIRNHPSLAIWIGDNENSASGRLDKKNYPGRVAAYLVNGPIVNRLDPYRRFMPSSPCGGKLFGSVTCGTAHGTMHLVAMFETICHTDMSCFHEMLMAELARFNNEVPVFGAPALSSMRRFLSDELLYDDDCLEYHTKNNPSGFLLEFPIYKMHRTFSEKLFGTFKDGEDKLFKMRTLQFVWVRYMLEMYRRNRGYSSGILFWMLNDCWPSDSWSLIDYYMNPKAGWYAANQACKPIVGSIYETEGGYACRVENEANDIKEGSVKVSLWDVNGNQPVNEKVASFKVAPSSVVEALRIDWKLPEEGYVLVLDVFDTEGNTLYRTTYFPKRVVDLGLPSTRGESVLEVEEQGNGFIRIRAKKFAFVVNLDGDYIFEDNFFTMLPGEIRTIRFEAIKEASTDEVNVYVM